MDNCMEYNSVVAHYSKEKYETPWSAEWDTWLAPPVMYVIYQ